MAAHIETPDLAGELRLWEQTSHRRDLVLLELAQRLAQQAERDGRLLRKLETTRARLVMAGEARTPAQRRPALVWAS
jgi:hypothetical protein